MRQGKPPTSSGGAKNHTHTKQMTLAAHFNVSVWPTNSDHEPKVTIWVSHPKRHTMLHGAASPQPVWRIFFHTHTHTHIYYSPQRHVNHFPVRSSIFQLFARQSTAVHRLISCSPWIGQLLSWMDPSLLTGRLTVPQGKVCVHRQAGCFHG